MKTIRKRGFLSDKSKRLLLEISLATGKTTDEILTQEYVKTSVDHASGYLHAFASHARSQDLLLGFFV